jgi:hypothetical protein
MFAYFAMCLFLPGGLGMSGARIKGPLDAEVKPLRGIATHGFMRLDRLGGTNPHFGREP